ncbi:hypothetical protein, partial [Rhizobium leguminosarum]|uniref:hypothetical protein n=1 Tax=Rhizobium leguminosarum TaxID=384 RepID=UPI003F98784A
VAISSFGWAVPVALSGNLGDLKRWPDEERGLLEGLLAKLSAIDADGNPVPLTLHMITGAYEWLISLLYTQFDALRGARLSE